MLTSFISVKRLSEKMTIITWFGVSIVILVSYLLYISFNRISREQSNRLNDNVVDSNVVARTSKIYHTCQNSDWAKYIINNSYNNFTICYPPTWEIRNLGSSETNNNSVISHPTNGMLVFNFSSHTYDPQLSTDPNDSYSQFTNIPFEQTITTLLNKTKVNHYEILADTPKLKGIEYSYDTIYDNVEVKQVDWFISSTQQNNTYYNFNYPYDSHFDQATIAEGKKILVQLIEDFSDSK